MHSTTPVFASAFTPTVIEMLTWTVLNWMMMIVMMIMIVMVMMMRMMT